MTAAIGAYWPAPWTAEDGGRLRWGAPYGQPGLGIAPGEGLEVAAARDAFCTTSLIRREPGELYALRHSVPKRGPQSPVRWWVERLDPKTLQVTASTPELSIGAFWPGGVQAHGNGDLISVAGHWAHRLTPDLEIVAARELPVPRPHNSFVLLDSGAIVTKDCDAPAGREPATVSVLEPDGLEPLAAPLRLPEPCIARLASDGESVIVIGAATAFRIRLDDDRLVVDETWQPRYGGTPGRSFGWDPVIADEHVFWMDNGRNHVDRTMLGSGTDPEPLRLWWARRDDATLRSTEISGLPLGTESNPPGWDPVGKIVVAYDAGHAVVRAWRLDGDDLMPLWRRDGLAHAAHLIVFPDTRELVVGDWRDWAWMRRPLVRRAMRPGLQFVGRSATARRQSLRSGQDHLVVLDLDTGEEKARVAVPSPSQGFLFSAPGFDRDVYYQSLTTIARVVVR